MGIGFRASVMSPVCFAGCVVDYDACALFGESSRDGCTDVGCTAGDENGFLRESWIDHSQAC